MPTEAGFFLDWDGNARSTLEPGGSYLCETDVPSRYVAITTKGGGRHRKGRHQGAACSQVASLGQVRRRVLTETSWIRSSDHASDNNPDR